MSDGPASAFAEAPSAQRIRFVESLPAGATPLAAFRDPYARWAIGEPVELESALRSSLPSPAPQSEFTFVFLPSGSTTPIELQRRAEAWVSEPPLARESPAIHLPVIDLVMQSDRILWRPGSAVVIGSSRRMSEVLAGLVEFSYYEAELRRLEQELEVDWPAAEADVSLTHGVDRQALARRGHVNEMTRRMALRRIRFARLAPRLEKAPLTLSGPMRRLFSELAQQADVVDRLRSLDDRLEVFEDLYELANDRLGELSYFQKEHRLEAWILAMLLVEVFLMLFEIWWSWRLDGL
jgi:hypothetical protein